MVMIGRPLLVTASDPVMDHVLAMAAAQGIDMHVAPDIESARSRWSGASIVIVGDDLAAAAAQARLPRREGLVLACLEESEGTWRSAVALGAEHVARLPDADRWLLDRMAAGSEGPGRGGVVISVMPASGGAGASTFAVTLARTLALSMRAVVIDADHWGAGLEIMMGLEDTPGLRWPDLADTRGRLGAASLVDALPSIEGVGVLSSSRLTATPLQAAPFAAVLDAAVRGYDAVIVDLPRRFDDVYECASSMSARAVVVATARVRSALAARLVLAEWSARVTHVDLVVRSEGRGLSQGAVEATTGAHEALRLPASPRVAMSADSGELPALRDPYGRACADFVRTWARGIRRAA